MVERGGGSELDFPPLAQPTPIIAAAVTKLESSQ
jgi:hypothetical protein